MTADLVARIGPILLFLVFATVLAELCAGLGLFDLVADGVVHAAHGSVRRVWVGLVAVAVASTAVLSLDTTAVLLTPVVLAVAVRLRINPVLFAMTTVLLANTASLFLPVSNLTNLLALSHLDLSAVEYVALMALPGLVAVLVTVAVLAVLHRRTLALPRREYDEPAPLEGPRAPVVVAALACLALGPALTLTGRVTVVSGLACGAVVLACAVWRRDLLHLKLVPWLLVVAVAALFFVVQLGPRARPGRAGGAADRHRRGAAGAAPPRRGGRRQRQRDRQPAGLPRAGAHHRGQHRAAGRAARRRRGRPAGHPVGERGHPAVGAALPRGRAWRSTGDASRSPGCWSPSRRSPWPP